MFHIINSIPLWIRIIVLIVCEILMIFEYAKGKLENSKSGKSLIMLLIVFDPIFIGIMLFGRCEEFGLVSSPSLNLSIVFIVAFVLGVWAVAIANVIKGNLPNPQKRMIIGAFIVFLLAIIYGVVITILEKNNQGTVL